MSNYTYKLFEDGYDIMNGNNRYLSQRDPYGKLLLPYGTYEENAIAHCEQLNAEPEPSYVSPEEKLRSDVDYLSLMLDIPLPSEEEEGE